MLTDKQLEVVMHLCNGLTLEEIAEAMHYSESNIRQHIRLAKKKADAKSTAHLVAIVIVRGSLYWTPGGMTTEAPEGTGADEPKLAGPQAST